MIWIVSGPSSAGKSHFLGSSRAMAVTGLSRTTRVWFPKEIGPGAPPPGEDAFVHYNILRPFQKAERPGGVAVGPGLFAGDAQWRAILALPGTKKAVVIVAPKEVLVERVKERTGVERDDPHAYNPARWLRIYEAIDLAAVYREWRTELARHGITSVDVDSGGPA